MIGLYILLVAIGVGAIAAVLLLKRAAHRAIDKRIHLMTVPGEAKLAAPVAEPSSTQMADDYARRIFGFGIRHRWGVKSGAVRIGVFAIIGFIVTFAFLHFIVKFGFWAALGGSAITLWLLPHMVLRRERSKAELQFVELFADAVDMVVRMLRAGLPVTAAIRTAGSDGPPPVNEVFAGISDQVEIGIPFDEALVIAADQVGIQDFRFFAAAVALQRATGGNLAATLETLSDIIRRRRGGRMKARAVTSEVRATAFVLAALPFFILTALLILNPQYLAPLIDDPRGNVIIAVAAGLLITAFVTMRQMMRSATKI
jgi:tight adherence protein B